MKEGTYYQQNREERLEYQKDYYQENKEKVLEYQKDYYQENREKRSKYYKDYYQENKEHKTELERKYRKTPMGRASSLLKTYNKKDKFYKRGKGNLTAKWIVENIFSKPCTYCGITGWEIIGCNRKDNALPHTKDNVEPCCPQCNKRLPK